MQAEPCIYNLEQSCVSVCPVDQYVHLANLSELVEPGDPPVPRFVAEFRRS
jgi:hypothetical protein